MQYKWIRCKKTQHLRLSEGLIVCGFFVVTALTITQTQNCVVSLPIMVSKCVTYKTLRACHYIRLCDFLSNFKAYMLIIPFTSGSVYSIRPTPVGGYAILDITKMSKMTFSAKRFSKKKETDPPSSTKM